MGKYRVLTMVPYFDKVVKVFNEVAQVDSIWGKKLRLYTEDELAELLPNYDACVVWIDPLKGRAMEAGKHLKAIGVPRAGYDNVDVKKATEYGIPVVFSPGANSSAVADFTMGLILSLVRSIAQKNHEIKEGNLKGRWALVDDVGFGLEGKVLGILGLGNIGCRVALRAKAFGMHIIGYDPFVDENTQTGLGVYPTELGIELSSFEDLLKRADIITLHLPITPETKGLIGERELSLMKPNSYIINTSRGKIIDEGALYKALKERRIRGAALDVFVKEPLDYDNPLLKLDNVILTPHIAWCTEEAIYRSNYIVAKEITRILKGERPNLRNVANPIVIKL
ncbi:MAG: hydroxyacid dehydrogenase [Nitrososphaerales archaeon]